MERELVKEIFRAMALETVEKMLEIRIKQKGEASWASFHELRGSLDEEFEELKEAFHLKERTKIYWELMDLAVAAIFGLACMEARTI